MTQTPIKDAASIILLRDPGADPKVLMGQRGSQAAFMPNKFVFPGGAVDPSDHGLDFASPLGDADASRLAQNPSDLPAHTIAAAAIRELWEEAGLILGAPGQWSTTPHHDWQGFAQTGHLPTAEGLHFIFRAITPPGRPRRFDARFFVANANTLASDPDDFSAASDELSHLQWVPLDQTHDFDLPFITQVVLAEVAATLPNIAPPDQVPFFNNTDEHSLFERLSGQSPLAKFHP